jgi:hypothetical protein
MSMEEVETPATIGRRTYVAAWFRRQEVQYVLGRRDCYEAVPRVQSWHQKKLFSSEKHYPEKHVVGLE